ncbi:hypothetical protein BDZ91DRAFT_749702 [Kalaharituber pfeilii]|nr:hypothetical protein BDZ91DRAFT_749702 [Kalaharituber pfeilii]
MQDHDQSTIGPIYIYRILLFVFLIPITYHGYSNVDKFRKHMDMYYWSLSDPSPSRLLAGIILESLCGTLGILYSCYSLCHCIKLVRAKKHTTHRFYGTIASDFVLGAALAVTARVQADLLPSPPHGRLCHGEQDRRWYMKMLSRSSKTDGWEGVCRGMVRHWRIEVAMSVLCFLSSVWLLLSQTFILDIVDRPAPTKRVKRIVANIVKTVIWAVVITLVFPTMVLSVLWQNMMSISISNYLSTIRVWIRSIERKIQEEIYWKDEMHAKIAVGRDSAALVQNNNIQDTNAVLGKYKIGLRRYWAKGKSNTRTATASTAQAPAATEIELGTLRRAEEGTMPTAPGAAAIHPPSQSQRSPTEQYLLRVLSNYECARTIAMECHYMDLKRLMLVSRDVRGALLGSLSGNMIKNLTCREQDKDEAEIQAALAADEAQSKKECWVCWGKICKGCTNPYINYHLAECKTYCSPCFRSLFCENYSPMNFFLPPSYRPGPFRLWSTEHASHIPASVIGIIELCNWCNELRGQPMKLYQMRWEWAKKRLAIECAKCRGRIKAEKGEMAWWGCENRQAECRARVHYPWEKPKFCC